MAKSSYKFVLLFVVLSIIGLALLPRIPIQLAPSKGGRTLTITYSWAGASPETIERQITVRLEGILAMATDLRKIRSVSSYNHGYVILELDKAADADAVRFEVAALIRQVYPTLPRQISYPQISIESLEEQSRTKPLLTLQLSGPVSTADLQRYADDQIKPRLAATKGIGEVTVFGGGLSEWVMVYNTDALAAVQVTAEQIRQALKTHFNRESLGIISSSTGQSLRVSLNNAQTSRVDSWSHIPVTYRAGRILYLTDLVSITKQEPPLSHFYRINGKTAVNVLLSAQPGTNQLTLVRQLRNKVATLQLPPGYRIDVEYDATIYIQENFRKIGVQTFVAIVVLILFVSLTTRSLRYVTLIIISTIVSLLVSVIVFVWLGVEIHLYSLAALTTSLGIMMDNVIVMIDHYRRFRNLHVFTALLGSTLTTCAGLIVVWFLPEENRQVLSDFAVVMAVTLFVSLLVAITFIPAVMERFWRLEQATASRKLKVTNFRKTLTNQQLVESVYRSFLLFLLRYRRWVVTGSVVLFGLPVFLLPQKLKKENSWAFFYNTTIGSDYYAENLRPYINRWLGGTLRLFINYVYEGSYQREPERTALYVVAELPNQSTPEQMDAIFRRLEINLCQYGEIDKIITQISSGQEGSMVIYFKEPYDKGIFPYQVKNRAILISTEMSGIDWNIFGVGQGYSQSLNEEESPTFTVEMRGYNYHQLEQQASVLKRMLENHPRIQEVNINQSPSLFQRKKLYEFVLQTDEQALAFRGIGATQLYNHLAEFNARPQPDQYVFIKSDYEPIKLIPVQSKTVDIWQLQHQTLTTGQTLLKLSDVGFVSRQKVTPEIHKEDQQYKRLVSFEYNGSYNFGERFLNKILLELKPVLPLGYTAKAIDRFRFSLDDRTPYELIGLVILLIYIVCAIIFESLWQPLALIGLIPLSYTGVFLAFYLTGSHFDQGGYASFILLAGNVVCAGIFIVAEMNRLHKRYPNLSAFMAYQKAFRNKIGPVLLTVLSTVVGMVPFLLYEKEPFWYAFGISTIGGLLMSLFAICFYLPLFLLKEINVSLQQ